MNPQMVDVSEKKVTTRTATAQCIVVVPDEVFDISESNEVLTKKGPVFQTAIIAGTMGVKKCSELIPMCHPLAIEKIKIDISFMSNNEIQILCTVKISGKTGVEMEALTGCSVAALTIYDMCKAISHNIVIKETKLLEKTGGKNDVHLQS